MYSPRDRTNQKLVLLGIFIIGFGILALVSLIKIVGKVILLLAIVVIIGALANKFNQTTSDDSERKRVKSTRSDSGVGKALGKWWRS